MVGIEDMSILKDFKQRLSAADEYEACRKAVKQQFPKIAASKSKVDVEELIKSEEISIHVSGSDAVDGTLSWDSTNCALITVSSLIGHARRRFTLAHELGHWIVQKVLLGKPRQTLFRGVSSNRAEVQEEERLANLLAAEILLPWNEMESLFSGSSLSIRFVREIAKRFDVSKLAVLRRIADVTDLPIVFINAVPYRFRNLASAAEIDDAIYLAPRKPSIFDRERTRFTERVAFRDITSSQPFRATVRGSMGEIEAEFEVVAQGKPVPNVDLLANKCRPLCEQAKEFLDSTTAISGKAWTKGNVGQLEVLVKQNTPTRVIGLKLGRTPEAVYAKASEQGISLKLTNQSPYGSKKR